MSQAFDSTDYIQRTANVPTNSAFTIGAWLYFNSLPAANRGIFGLTDNPGNECLALRWNTATSKFRVFNSSGSVEFSTNPTTGQWYYVFIRTDGVNANGGWKDIDDTSFTGSGNTAVSLITTTKLWVGGLPTVTTSADMHVFRLSVWDAYVSDANLLLAAATDKGYATSLNTHLPLTNGIGSPWADTSGNARDWTTSGTFSDQSDPSLGSSTKPAFYYAQL